MGENMEETIDELSAALEELESGQGLSRFTGGHGVQSRVFDFRWSEPSLEIDFRLPYDLAFDDDDARKARETEIGAALRMAILLLKTAGTGGFGGRVSATATSRGVFYEIVGEDGEPEDSGDDWSHLANRLENALGFNSWNDLIIRP